MRLFKPTKVCKLCFNNIKTSSLINFIKPNLSLCSYCYKKLVPVFYEFKVEGCKVESLYLYNNDIKGLLYQLKGCYDIELAPIFFDRYLFEYRLKYYDFVLVPAPSYIEDDKKREFNHVEEIYKPLKLPFEKIIVKTKQHKQSEQTRESRKEIVKVLKVINGERIRGKKVLIVDDVFTTGSTVRSIIKLIKPFKPKQIRVLVMSKTNDDDYIKKY